MAYCRFSSDNWKCDVYVYESEDGFEVHVAASRHNPEPSPVPEWGSVSNDEWFAAYHSQVAALGCAEQVSIGGPCDGEHFTYQTLDELHAALKDIREKGYHVPQWVLEGIEGEMIDYHKPPLSETAAKQPCPNCGYDRWCLDSYIVGDKAFCDEQCYLQYGEVGDRN